MTFFSKKKRLTLIVVGLFPKNKVCFHVDPERDLTFTGLDAEGFKLGCFPLLTLDLVCTKARVIPP